MNLYLILALALVREASATQSMPETATIPSSAVDSDSTDFAERLSKTKERTVFPDQQNRTLSSANCEDNEQVFRIDITTDNYGYENRWKLLKNTRNGPREIFSGPKGDRNYSANQSTVGFYCLTPGTYTFVITDKFNDGMCCEFGEGKYVGRIGNAQIFSSPRANRDADWEERVHEFEIAEDSNNDLPLSPKIGTGVMTSRDQEWLDEHNSRREKWHNSFGKDYVPLKWSRALMRESQTWAKKLARNCELEHDQNSKYGENIALNYGWGGYGQMRPTGNVLTRFVEDEADDEYPENGHFTQVLWRATTYVGCADASRARREGGTCHTQVCRYSKPGNCNMSKHKSESRKKKWWLTPMLMDESPCGEECPPDGCT